MMVPDSPETNPRSATMPSHSSPDLARRRRLAWSSVVLSVVVVLGVVRVADAERVWGYLRAVDLRWFGATFLFSLIQTAILGLRWARVAGWFEISIGWLRASAEVWLSVALNLLLPGGFAGDGLRAWRQRRAGPRNGTFQIVEAVLLDRLSGQVALWGLALFAIPWTLQCGASGAPEATRVGTDALVVILVALAVVALGSWWLRTRGGFTPWLGRVRRYLARTAKYLFLPPHAQRHLPLSLVLVAILLVQFYFAARAIGIHLPWQHLLGLGPLVLVASSLPSFFGGWGPREVASALLFAHAGAHASAGVAVSLVFGAFATLASSPGLLVSLLRVDVDGEESPR